MNLAAVDRIAKALLYEGYMLYPYRASAIKNRQRFNFGVLYPRSYAQSENSENWTSQAQCILLASEASTIELCVRFLHLVERTVYERVPPFTNATERRPTDRLTVDGEIYQSWQEAVEREICIPVTSLDSLRGTPVLYAAEFPASSAEEEIRDCRGQTAGMIARAQSGLNLRVEVNVHAEGDGIFKLTVKIANVTETLPAPREQALLQAAVSTHIILAVEKGKFVSLLDPPIAMRALVDSCQNVGGFPVLVGKRGEDDNLLFSPIILYDYPEIASESTGDLFDATEIDEILSLRIMTLTDDEKREVRNSDARARSILERTETLSEEQLLKLHGAVRGLRPIERERAG